MALAPDPADKQLDAAADGAFGGVSTMGDISEMSQTVGTNRRAGYGGVEFEGREYTKMEWLLRAAKRGDCLAWGDAAKLVAYYEGLVSEAFAEGYKIGCSDSFCYYSPSRLESALERFSEQHLEAA